LAAIDAVLGTLKSEIDRLNHEKEQSERSESARASRYLKTPLPDRSAFG